MKSKNIRNSLGKRKIRGGWEFFALLALLSMLFHFNKLVIMVIIYALSPAQVPILEFFVWDYFF